MSLDGSSAAIPKKWFGDWDGVVFWNAWRYGEVGDVENKHGSGQKT
jgi:hypothetical protein